MGRSITENVVALEGTASLWARLFATDLLMVLFDVAAAFPALHRRLLFDNLARRGLPPNWLKAVQVLHEKVSCWIKLGPERFKELVVTIGIKQGCPLSGSLFVLAYDCCICYLAGRISPNNVRIFGYADDISAVLRWCWHYLPMLLHGLGS